MPAAENATISANIALKLLMSASRTSPRRGGDRMKRRQVIEAGTTLLCGGSSMRITGAGAATATNDQFELVINLQESVSRLPRGSVSIRRSRCPCPKNLTAGTGGRCRMTPSSSGAILSDQRSGLRKPFFSFATFLKQESNGQQPDAYKGAASSCNERQPMKRCAQARDSSEFFTDEWASP
jgi:hypothetical protein